MSSFYRSGVGEFLAVSNEHVLAHLATAYAKRGYTSQYSDQTLTWDRDIASLRSSLEQCALDSESSKGWGLLLEFSIPRKELRIDAVLLIRDSIVVLEAKTGLPSLQAKRQIEEYALLLHYFHKESSNRRIVPVIVSPEPVDADFAALNQRELFPQLFSYWVSPVLRSSWQNLPDLLVAIGQSQAAQMLVGIWDESPYFPVPSIIEAALALRKGLSIREIAHSEASEYEIETVKNAIQEIVDRAREGSHHAICFLTGVPGSGKTLVGLSLAHSDENRANAIHFIAVTGRWSRSFNIFSHSKAG